MNKNLFIKAEEIATELGVSKPYAYKLIRKLNEELKSNSLEKCDNRNRMNCIEASDRRSAGNSNCCFNRTERC